MPNCYWSMQPHYSPSKSSRSGIKLRKEELCRIFREFSRTTRSSRCIRYVHAWAWKRMPCDQPIWSKWYDWLKGFMKRYGLTYRHPKSTTKARAHIELSDVEEFITQTTNHFIDCQYPPQAIFNVDETIIFIDQKSRQQQRIITLKGIAKSDQVVNRADDTCCCVSFVNAAGEAFLQVIIVKGTPVAKPKKKSTTWLQKKWRKKSLRVKALT